mmetsp:Transcript_37976/g.49010  ORF Transcript_37976/g.49010 Transcript_37976/m.49010 type:complete len:339 (+) Transcript_37976:74-1090(+)
MKLSVKDKKLFQIAIPVAVILIIFIIFLGNVVGVLDDPLRFFGFLFCGKVSFEFMKFLRQSKLFRRSCPPKFYGDWAIVTGCTSGIGEAFSYRLAEEGMNIILISRSPGKLKTVSNNIEKKYPVQTKIIIHDFASAPIDAVLKSLSAEVSSLEGDERIGILVNNVGVANENPELFHLLPKEKIDEIMNVNLRSVVSLTHAVLPHMLEKNRGAIINISSACGTHPTPLLAVYSATKAFMTQFSNSISYEYEKKGIDVLVITPYYFLSSYFKTKEPTLGIPHPSTVVNGTLRRLGCYKQAFPYWFHALQRKMFDFHPDWPKRLMKSMKANKKRAESKKSS